MINSTVAFWIDQLKEKHSVNELHELPIEVLEEEIDGARGTIDNCTIVDDEYGICCNKRYIEYLNEAIVIQKLNQ